MIDPADEQRLIRQAQEQIAKILAGLERETGMLVSSLRVKSMNITTYSDPNPQYAQAVEIEMYRLPGHGW